MADERAFAERCEDDRHHFRFTVSPEDATEMADLRAFTRELMADAERDLETKLDWIAVDHWNTDNPHIHVLLRGRADDGKDLVISRDYISHGFRQRAAERVTLELGPRSEQEIRSAWSGKSRRSAGPASIGHCAISPTKAAGLPICDPARMAKTQSCGLLLGRAAKLERLGLADLVGPACWTLKPGLEETLRELGIRGDIINATGATWIDRQLLAKDPPLSGGGFGAEVRNAMDRRADHLIEEGLARRMGQRTVFARDLLNTLRRRELNDAVAKLSTETGLAHQPSTEGEHVAGTYRQQVTLTECISLLRLGGPRHSLSWSSRLSEARAGFEAAGSAVRNFRADGGISETVMSTSR